MIRWYRLLLRAYPPAIRRAFGRDMTELFADLVRDAHRRRGPAAAAAVAVRSIADALWHGASTRREQRRRAPSMPPSRRPQRGASFDVLAQTLRHSVRSLRRSPGFVFVVVVTLTVGIGANTVMFTVLDGILLTPLPYVEADRLVRLYNAWPEDPDDRQFVAGAGFLDYREQSEIFEGLAAAYTYRQTGADLTNGGETQRIAIMPVSSGFFELLGVEPFLGREFRRDEETADANVAVISHGLWRTAFAADPDILGRDIDLQGVPHTVVGVMPAGFRNPLGGAVDLWRPENLQPGGRNSWSNYYLSVVGRLRDDVSLAEARERLRALGVAMFEADDSTHGAFAAIYPLLDETVGDARAMLWVLMGAVAMVLLIACVNVASLFLVRAGERWKELSIRAALGAGRRRLVGQMLTESIVLGVAGGLGGLLLSVAGLRLVVALTAGAVPRVQELGVNAGMFAFATAVSVITGVLFGMAPALRFSRPDLERALRAGDRGNSGGRSQQRLRAVLVVAEIALALILLVGAGLLTKSFGRIVAADLGFERSGVLTYEVHLPTSRYPDARDRIAFYDRFFARVAAIPGVEAVGATSYLPSEGRYHIWSLGREDLDLDDDESWTGTDVRIVDGDYLRLMGIQLIRGRLFDGTDTIEAFEQDRGAVLLNESLASAAFPDRDPLGADVTFGGDDFRVVGIVADTAYDPLGSTSPKVYATHDQFAGDRNWAMIQTVRTAVQPASIVDQLRDELRAVDAQLVLYRMRTLEDVVADGVSPQRFSMALMAGFAVIALLLAAIGIYGVLSYGVAQRTREIGIRMALGADRGRVRRLVLRQALTLTAIGFALGLAGSWAFASALSSLLFQVRPGDPVVLAVVTAAIAGVALIAGVVPVRRATTVDPIEALRKD